ncbi:substrate-binding domain-containing protein [Hydrogenophaga sp. RWCD_12]|uniref:substrate-binding domain-containing protein n=1 Tax=Hydrogenophaga sp. RWCD_12 TaxID=3391190 RepID=UPI003984D0FE
MLKRLLTTGVAAFGILCLPLTANAQKFGLAMSEQDAFLSLVQSGVVEAAKASGVSLVVEDAKGRKAAQLDQIRAMAAQRLDAIIVVPVDTEATRAITLVASEAKIPLVYVNRKPVDFDQWPAGVALVASDEKVSGTVQSEEVCRLLNGRGQIVVLMGPLSNEAARTRTQDIEDVLARPACSGIRILDKRLGGWDRGRAFNIVLNLIASGANTGRRFDAVVANNDEMALGAIDALKAANAWSPGFVVAGIDATPQALSSMKLGDLKVTVRQNATGQGAGAVQTALKMIRKQPVARFVDVPFELVTPSNLNKFLPNN